MKANIHPKYYPEAQVKCACGNHFKTGATVPEISVEVCSNCHPYFTGKQRFIDAEGRVDKFNAKVKAAEVKVYDSNAKKAKNALRREKGPKLSLNSPENK